MKPHFSCEPPKTPFLEATLFFVLAVMLLFGGAFSQATGQELTNCRKCQGKGWLPCKNHPKSIQENETAIRCSETISCKKCGGTVKIDCTYCDADVADFLATERDECRKWLEKLREIDDVVKSENVMHSESKHFILTYNLPRITVAKQVVKTHAGMHLYLERLEDLYHDVIDDLGATDEDFLAKTHVMIWEREHEIVRTAEKYCHQNSNTKSYLLGKAPILTLYYDKGALHEEYELHQAVVHNVVHCLLSNVWNGIWPGNIRGAWLDAGYAHHYELLYFKQYGGGVRNYCYREADTSGRFKFGKWKSTVRKQVDKGEAPSFLEVSAKNLDQLAMEEHMFSWSYVDFLMKEYPGDFGPLARLIKERKGIAEVMKEALRMTPFQFEEQWKGYVQSSYSTKEEPWGKPTIGRRRRG